ncbi:DUF4383 domain-containing protein [Micromonospora sp. NPDC000089]|uniref:DUF4383 domain-containing protein n=1 Tax=unclassified Micromonospora TaxID=2617518 RepID=UPI0036AF3093
MAGPMAHSRARRNPADGRAPVRRAAATVGVLFLLVGGLGFLPGITTDYADLRLAGPGSGAELFGVFRVSVLHNALHLAFGVAGLVLSRRAREARAYLLGGGAVYLVLALYGLVVDKPTGANFLPVDDPDGWLHLGLGLGMIGLGLLTRRDGHRR